MIPVGANGTAAPQSAIHRTRHADGQAADSARERRAVVSLHDQMEMVILNAELNDAEATARCSGQRTADARTDTGGPEASDGGTRANRDVHGMSGMV